MSIYSFKLLTFHLENVTGISGGLLLNFLIVCSLIGPCVARLLHCSFCTLSRYIAGTDQKGEQCDKIRFYQSLSYEAIA